MGGVLEKIVEAAIYLIVSALISVGAQYFIHNSFLRLVAVGVAVGMVLWLIQKIFSKIKIIKTVPRC